jgi:hypothetical protein
MFVITNFRNYVTTLLMCKKNTKFKMCDEKMCDFLDFNIVITTYV